MSYLIILAALIGFGFILKFVWKKEDWKAPKTPFPEDWKKILKRKVSFYNTLSPKEAQQFEFKIQEFLLNCRITGINTTVDTTDQLLVAASAIIPVFAFPEWKYTNLFEVLIYPEMFNKDFETTGEERRILGMVGTGYMEGKMILSKKALHHGFANESDKKNTAIHEFVHLIDKLDGTVDGIPQVLLEKQYSIPWLELINQKMDEIYEEESDINPYGGTNKAEFYAVASEYFFERPKLLAKKHPKLYTLMQEMFQQDMRLRKEEKIKKSIGRNSPCPCNSGLKFKKCCGRSHFN